MKNFISINIFYIRKKNYLSQSELSEKYGLSANVIGTYERDIANPQIPFIQQFCKDYNINIDDFVNKDLSTLQKTNDISQVKEPEAAYKLDDAIKTYLAGYEKSLLAMQKTIDVKDDVIRAKDEQIILLKKNYTVLEVLLNQNDALDKLKIISKIDDEIEKSET